MLSYITWTVDPAIFQLGGLEVRWYGLCFAIGFWVGYKICEKMFKVEQVPQEWLDALFIYIIVATVIGARLGHCLFYQFDYYSQHPVEIFKVWEGGLASHGGAIGIVIAVWLYSRRVTKRSMLWTFDRLVVPVACVGGLIRLGNLMNHEIYGHPADVPWAFRFITNIPHYQKGLPPIFSEPSHPTQIYEAAIYLLTFAALMFLYWKTNFKTREGLIFGIFLVAVFLSRFFIEFIKEHQVEFENNMLLDMGQLLSIPFFIVGFALIYRALKNPPKTYPRLKTKK
ncbi:MAG: prolipoprotein diacylglyceryl transferase [Bacteroidales bacterium]|jgi:prolipoprotein diacylglyceryl transferase|nr:prolipoprotein diacylglyceryl transferase [Bacteroidales bacterium]